MKLKSLCEEIATIDSVDDIKAIKQLVSQSYEWLESAFTLQPIDELVTGRAIFIDTLLQRLWSLYGLANERGLALVPWVVTAAAICNPTQISTC